jgi:hypothetical protein
MDDLGPDFEKDCAEAGLINIVNFVKESIVKGYDIRQPPPQSQQTPDQPPQGDASGCLSVAAKGGTAYRVINRCTDAVNAVIRVMDEVRHWSNGVYFVNKVGGGINNVDVFSNFKTEPSVVYACFDGQPGCTTSSLRTRFPSP